MFLSLYCGGASGTAPSDPTPTPTPSASSTPSSDPSGSASPTPSLSPSGSASYISVSDKPTGWASYSAATNFGGYGDPTVTVTTRSDLITYAAKGNYVIYVSGMIDMSQGMLPSSYDGTTSALDSFISTNTSSAYTTYSAWRSAYAVACSTTTEDKSTSSSPQSSLNTTLWTLSKAYKAIIQLPIASNTTIIGLDSASGIKGGTISISGVSNIALRNLIIQDAYDPFPHHEAGDGYNSQYDGITIQGDTSHIWVDHCTFKDSFSSHVYVLTGGSTSEKWVTFDGLCDIKGNAQYITVSYCKFADHDKTMLFGSSDTESVSVTRTITLHHNYFTNCVQRLPMVRITTLHLYNNYFTFTNATDAGNGSTISSSYAVGARCNAKIVSENNYFGSGIKYSYTGTSDTSIQGTVYCLGDSDNSTSGKQTSYYIVASSMPWTPSSYYSYTPDTASTLLSTIPTNAGAGVWTVQK
jgi:pectate lyase